MKHLAQRLRDNDQNDNIKPLSWAFEVSERDPRISRLNDIAGVIHREEREIYNRIMVLLYGLKCSVISICQFGWSNYARISQLTRSDSYRDWVRAFNDVPSRVLDKYLQSYSPLRWSQWLPETQYLDLMSTMYDIMLVVSKNNPNLKPLGKPNQDNMSIYLEECYLEAMKIRPEKIRAIMSDLGIVEFPANNGLLTQAPEVNEAMLLRRLKVAKKSMGEWSEEDFWAEVTDLYNDARTQKDLKTLKEILFLRAKCMGLMRENQPPPQVNIINMFDQQATDMLKAMGMGKPDPRLEVASDQ